MNKLKYFLLLLLLGIVLSGCVLPNANISDSQYSTPELVNTPAYLQEISVENRISVQYPVFSGTNAARLNESMSAYIWQRVTELCGQHCSLAVEATAPDISDVDYKSYYINVEYYIANSQEDIISVVFEGTFSKRGTAHPTGLLFAVNLDPVTAEQIHFSDRYCVNDELYEAFAESAMAKITKQAGGKWPESFGDFSKNLCTKEAFLSGMKDEENFSFYDMGDSIVIIYPVAHALGDNFEAEIPNAALTRVEEK